MGERQRRPFGHAAVQKQLKFHLKDDAKHIPQIRISQGPPQLGKGSLDVEIKINDIDAPDFAIGAKRGDKVTFTGHLLVMIDKNRWVGFASNRIEQLVKRMVMVKEGAPDAVTLRDARRPRAAQERQVHARRLPDDPPLHQGDGDRRGPRRRGR